MAAPGMAMAAVGPRAWAAGETARMPRFYLDLKRHRDTAAAGETPWTPAVAVMYQVDEGLRLMQAEGDGVFARHAACQAMTRAGPAGASGSSCWRPTTVASRTVTAARIPDGARLVGVQQGAQGARPRARRRPGQAQGQDLPAGPPRLGHDGRDPRGDRRARGRRRSSTGLAVQPGRGRRRGAAGAASPATAPASRCPREDPRRRAPRARGPRAPARPPRRRRAARPRARRRSRRSCPTTTRSSSAARSRSTPS